MNDKTFAVLANEHRRALLIALLEESPRDDTVRIRADGGSGMEMPDRLQTALYHQHLPKLADCGFICWNEETHGIGKGPRFEEIRPLLEFVDEHTEH